MKASWLSINLAVLLGWLCKMVSGYQRVYLLNVKKLFGDLTATSVSSLQSQGGVCELTGTLSPPKFHSFDRQLSKSKNVWLPHNYSLFYVYAYASP